MAIIYHCSEQCPIHKKCFIIKTEKKLPCPIKVLYKCPAKHGKDISITIGRERPP